jgi:DNA-binding NarL/FixJ family response regulator
MLAEALALTGQSPRDETPPLPEFNLTRREREILALLSQRQTDPEIAARLFITTKTASNHVSSILSKLGVKNRREAAEFAMRHSLA